MSLSRALRLPIAAVAACSLLIPVVVVVGSGPASASSSQAAALVTASWDEASAAAHAREQGVGVVVESLTTETSLVEAQPDGTFRLTVDSVPVRVQQEGSWVPVDTSLVETSDPQWLSPVATTVAVGFSTGGTDELARVQLESGDWLVETWPLGILPAPRIDGATATYADVLPDVDLQLTAAADGMHEVVVVHTANAAANPALATLHIGVEGASVFSNSDGSTTAVVEGESNGGITTSDLRSNAPQAWDSSDRESGPEGPGGLAGALPVPVATSDDGIALDVASVVDSGVTYPLYIDPDWTGGQLHAWYVAATYPDQAYVDGGAWTDGNQQMGYIAGAYSADGLDQLVRAFWQMPTSAVAGKSIIAAAFNTTLVWGFNCSPSPMELWRVTGAPVGGTWNSTAGASWAQYLDGKNVAAGRSGCPATAVGFNVLAGVSAVAAAGDSSITLGMKASNEGSSSGWKRWAVGAQLIVTYNSKPTATYYWIGPSQCSTSATSPTYVRLSQPTFLSGTVADADGGNLSARFYVERDAAATATWTSPVNALPTSIAPSGYLSTAAQAATTQYVNVPASTFVTGHYRTMMKAYDGVTLSDASTWCYFEVTDTQPGLPGVTDVSPGPYYVGQPITLRFTSDPADGIKFFQYWWSYSGSTSPSQPPPGLQNNVVLCGSTRFGWKEVCADTNGNSPLITVAPLEQSSTLWVVGRDANGYQVTRGSVSSVAVPFLALPDPGLGFSTGHGWDTQYLSSPLPSSVDDLNVDTAMPITLGGSVDLSATSEVMDGLGAQPVLSYGDRVPVANVSPTFPVSTTTYINATPLGLATATPLGWIHRTLRAGEVQPAGTVAVYRCGTSSSSWTFVTVSPTSYATPCATSAIVGYIDTAGAGTALVECAKSATAHYLALGVCNASSTLVATVGYLSGQGPMSQTSSAPASIDQSYTVSAWMRPISVGAGSGAHVALAQLATNNSVQYKLGLSSSGNWLFCSSSGCAQGPIATPNQWQYVAGVWDAVNGQVRIYVGDSMAPSAIESANPVAPAATGTLVLGGAQPVQNKVPVDPWVGQIAYPTVLAGVANKLQRQNLYFMYPPN